MRIGLALAAGGSVGVAYHGAVLSALAAETGWDPRSADVMIGTSAGSLTSALLRAGVSASDLANISEGEPLSAEGEQLAAVGRPHRPRPRAADYLRVRAVSDPLAVLRGVLCPGSMSVRGLVMASLPSGGIPTDAISGGIDAVFAGSWPDRPLWLCSYDLRSGQRVVFGQEGAPPASVGQAVAASCAVPMYFQPVEIGGRRYIDGGVHSMINLDLAAGQDLDLVVAISPLSQAAVLGELSPATLMRRPMRARLQAEVGALRRTGVPVVAVQPGRSITQVMGLNPMDAARRDTVSKATRAGVRRWLREGNEGRQLARVLRRAESGSERPAASTSRRRSDLA